RRRPPDQAQRDQRALVPLRRRRGVPGGPVVGDSGEPLRAVLHRRRQERRARVLLDRRRGQAGVGEAVDPGRMSRFFALVAAFIASAALAQQRVIPLSELKSGTAFLGADLRNLQNDDFANPGMLWVERGEKLWSEPAGKTKQSCASCHKDAKESMRGVAARYPQIDAESGRRLDLEGRRNPGRTRRPRAEQFTYESEELLAITAYVARQSKGMPIEARIDGPAKTHFTAGEAAYRLRRGQMNLSCAHCHEANWGKRLLSETISQGQPN